MDDLLSGMGGSSSSTKPKSSEKKRKLGFPSATATRKNRGQDIQFKREIDPSERVVDNDDSEMPDFDNEPPPPMPMDDDSPPPVGGGGDQSPSSPMKGNLDSSMLEDSDDDDMDIPTKKLTTSTVRPEPAVEKKADESSALNTNLKSKLMDSARDSPDRKPAATGKPVEEDHSELLSYQGPELAQDTDRNETVSASFADMEKDEEGNFLFFWMDYYESKNRLILIGKVKNSSGQYVSCTMIINGGKRLIYVLPRNEAAGDAVKDEVSELLSREGNSVNKDDLNFVKKKYCFELSDVPKKELEVLQIQVPFSDKAPLSGHNSGTTFSHVFGRDTSFFEHFVLSKKIMGPCWLKISKAKGLERASWSKVDCEVEDEANVELIHERDAPPPPTFDIMSISIRTHLNSKTDRQEIWAISCRMYRDVKHDTTVPAEELKSAVYTDVRPVDAVFPPGFERQLKNPDTKTHKTEANLLASFIARIGRLDPDVIVGHDLEDRHLNLLVHALKINNTQYWSKISRLRQTSVPKHFGGRNEKFVIRSMMKGRLLCDLNNEMGQSLTSKCDTWGLSEMCNLYIQTKRLDYDICTTAKTVTSLLSNAEGLVRYIEHNERDTFFMASLAFRIQILALSKQLTNLAGNSWARTLTGSRVDRNEYILLHEFTNQGYIVPDKPDNSDKNNKKKEGYTGGKVLDPEKGLHQDVILVMDFNSLYPSIIQEFNICFTTVDRNRDKDYESEESMPEAPGLSKQLGILPRLIKSLVERRREVKRLMKDEKAELWRKAQWDIKQQSYKLTANSMYGCLGFPQSRFYALPLAKLTTAKGREALTRTKELVEGNGYNVIYGDTDSIMVDTKASDYSKAIDVGKELRKVVNEQYRELEIDIDNVFQRMLLVAKKKYAALEMKLLKDGTTETKMEIKGLDMVKRGFCDLAKDTSRYVLDKILGEPDFQVAENSILEHLEKLVNSMKAGEIKLPKYLIRTRLGKDPAAYNQSQIPTVVAIALRRRQKGDLVTKGDVIQYVVTGTPDMGGNEKALGERSFTMPELKENGAQPDVTYYLTHQVEPTVRRLLEPIEGFDVVRILDALGLESRKQEMLQSIQRQQQQNNNTFLQPLDSLRPDSERFKYCESLEISCGKCDAKFAFTGIRLQDHQDLITAQGIKCSSCNEHVPMTRINIQLEVMIRNLIKRYYSGKVKCDDPSCHMETRQVGVYGRKCMGQDDECQGTLRFVYDDGKLYTQLLYFDSLFDVDRAKNNAMEEKDDNDDDFKFETVRALAEQNRVRFSTPRRIVDKYLVDCGRRYVDFHAIFSFMM